MSFRGIFILQSILFVFFLGLGAYYNFTSFELLTRYTKEDGFIEWMTFLLFMSLFFFMLIYNINLHFIQKVKINTFKKITLIALCLIFLFGAMEEVSWLQRIADIQTSDFFMKHNAQAETNLHNLNVKGVKINKLIFGKLLFLFALFHNVVIPLLARKKKWIWEKVDSIGFFLPHLYLVFLYVGGAIFVELAIEHERAKEHLEVIGALHYFSAMLISYGFGYGVKHPIFKNANKKLATAFVSAYLVFLTFIAWILGNVSLKDFML